jgi:TM2 domain-containing membrane protein YozV
MKKRLIHCAAWTLLYTLIKIPVDYFIDGYVKLPSPLLTLVICPLIYFFIGYPISEKLLSRKKSDNG